MYSFRKLSGHTLWTGPVLQKGIDLRFGIRQGGPTTHGRFIDATLSRGDQLIKLEPLWAIDLVRSGISIFTGGQGLPAQLKNVMFAITGFEVRLQDNGFCLVATLRDDETSEGLGWRHVASNGSFDPAGLFRPESLGGERKTLAFSDREAYPVATTVSEETTV